MLIQVIDRLARGGGVRHDKIGHAVALIGKMMVYDHCVLRALEDMLRLLEAGHIGAVRGDHAFIAHRILRQHDLFGIGKIAVDMGNRFLAYHLGRLAHIPYKSVKRKGGTQRVSVGRNVGEYAESIILVKPRDNRLKSFAVFHFVSFTFPG